MSSARLPKAHRAKKSKPGTIIRCHALSRNMATVSNGFGEEMNRLICLFCAIAVLGLGALSGPVTAAEMTFQLINDTDRALNLRLFSRADSRQQWPSKSKAYSLRPDSAVQQLKISCEEGEQICWGAWMTVQSISGEVVGPAGQRATRTSKFTAGVGERGQRSCERCCHICKDGLFTPVMGLHDPRPEAR